MHNIQAVVADTFDANWRPPKVSGVVIGPSELIGGRVQYHAKHLPTQRYFKFGNKEKFLVEMMDGTLTISEINARYREAFSRDLPWASWDQFLHLLERRGMLAGMHEQLDAKPSHAVQREGFLSYKFVIANPDDVLQRMLPFVNPLLRPVPLVLIGIVAFSAEWWLIRNWATVWGSAIWPSAGDRLWFTCCLVVLTLALIVIHELAHGVVCKKYGGQVQEAGIIFKYVLFFPYVRLDDLALLHNRHHRVYALAAGTLSTLALLPLFVVFLLMSSSGSTTHAFWANVVIWSNLAAWVNVIPFLELDGYLILAHTLKMPHLRSDSSRYLQDIMACLLGKRQMGEWNISRLQASTLVAYGILSWGVVLYFLPFIVLRWWSRLLGSIGPVGAGIGVAALVGWRLYRVFFRSSRQRGAKP